MNTINPNDDRVREQTVASWDVDDPWTTKTVTVEDKLQRPLDYISLSRQGRYELVFIPQS